MRAAGLAEMELFADCSAEQLHAVAQRLRPLRAAAGQTLMKQGDEALSFILIHTGRAEIRRMGEDDTVVLDEVLAGQIVGEIALLRNKPRTATVTAAELLTAAAKETAAPFKTRAGGAVTAKAIRAGTR